MTRYESNEKRNIWYEFVKRCVDILFSLIAIIVLSPLFIVIAFLVWRNDKGSVIFRRRVIGRGGKEFDMFKFRSMVMNAEQILDENKELLSEYKGKHKLENDPRITKIGSFLRTTSIDELPQFFNVLFGTMSLVGPRPIHGDEAETYGSNLSRFITVKPGMTGLWQIYGRSNTTYEERVKYDMAYIKHRSIWYDFWVLVMTVPAVILKRGAI
ncbi:MAG: sugar transferase [Abditibacteriota bacterium]|nr:sugar transferase [Abditibacteriota bacterium]MBP5739235.1 sugar transferase [Abditibacteriota bacterium]